MPTFEQHWLRQAGVAVQHRNAAILQGCDHYHVVVPHDVVPCLRAACGGCLLKQDAGALGVGDENRVGARRVVEGGDELAHVLFAPEGGVGCGRVGEAHGVAAERKRGKSAPLTLAHTGM